MSDQQRSQLPQLTKNRRCCNVNVTVSRTPSDLPDAREQQRGRTRYALGAAASLGALGAFVALSRAVAHSKRIERMDDDLMRRIARFRTPHLNEAVRDVTSLGGLTLAALTAIGSMVLVRRSPLAMLQIALGSMGGILAEVGIKRRFARPRPETIQRLQLVTSWSYPSGHSIASASLFLTLAFVGSRHHHGPCTRAALLTTAGVLATIVGTSRVYLGVHYPSDVIGGLALGTAWACMLESLFDYVRAHTLDKQRHRLPQDRSR